MDEVNKTYDVTIAADIEDIPYYSVSFDGLSEDEMNSLKNIVLQYKYQIIIKVHED